MTQSNSGLFRPPQSAVEKWDRGISSAAKKEHPGEIAILDEIGSSAFGMIDAKVVKQRLDAIGKGDVVVQLNTPGGNVFEGIAIYNLLRQHQGRVVVNVLGLAASAGSIIAMAGDQIRVSEAAQMMIHSAWGLVAGNKKDMRDFADVLDSVDAAISQIYASRTGISSQQVMAMMESETWMNADEAVSKKFADVNVSADDKKKKAKAEFGDQIVSAMRQAMARFSNSCRPGAIDFPVGIQASINRIMAADRSVRASHGASSPRKVISPSAVPGSPVASGSRYFLNPE